MKLQIRTQDVTKWCKLTAKKKLMNMGPCMNRPFNGVNGVTSCLKQDSNETIKNLPYSLYDKRKNRVIAKANQRGGQVS